MRVLFILVKLVWISQKIITAACLRVQKVQKLLPYFRRVKEFYGYFSTTPENSSFSVDKAFFALAVLNLIRAEQVSLIV